MPVRPAILSLAAAALAAPLALSTPAFADDHGDAEAMAESRFDAVLASAVRDEDRARDDQRNPAETLDFFRIEPDHTVIEYSPGGGWYTRILAPYLAEEGRYIAVNFPPEGGVPERFRGMIGTWTETFPGSAAEYSGVEAEDVEAYLGNAIPDSLDGQVDRVLIIRMLHNLKRWNLADSELTELRETLSDDGLVGIVQHKAPESASYGESDGNRGYLKQSDVVALMNLYGFELVAESEVNRNPADMADYEMGVWTLPPTFAGGEEDRERFEAIGESDRMTLLFKKAE